LRLFARSTLNTHYEIYLWRYRGIPEEKTVVDVSEYSRSVSRHRLRNCAKKYPKTLAEIVGTVEIEKKKSPGRR